MVVVVAADGDAEVSIDGSALIFCACILRKPGMLCFSLSSSETQKGLDCDSCLYNSVCFW